LRVLLGDPPVDWDLVRRIEEGPAAIARYGRQRHLIGKARNPP
jgi:hypothetical protein